MSVFTDDDLTKLKKDLVGYDPRLVTPLVHEYPKFNALVNRLQAAEVLLERLTNQNEPYELSDVDKDHELYLAWKKAAGKSND